MRILRTLIIVHTICHTRAFQRAASEAGMTAGEISRLEDLLGRNPEAGEEIVGTGGCRKLRFARPGKGKSGGYRVITFFTGQGLPLFLITVFAKSERANLSQAERNGLAQLTSKIVSEYARAQRT
jgi:hypothetical protein